MDDETRDILNLVKTNAVSNDPGVTIGDFKFDRGLNYDWSQRMSPPPARDAMLEGGSWLEEAVSSKDATEWTPFTTEVDGKPMAIDASMVKNDQQELLLTVMSKVKEWVECSAPLQVMSTKPGLSSHST